MENEIPIKEYTISKILSESLKRMKENFLSIILISLIVYIPTNIIFKVIPDDKLVEQKNLIMFFIILIQALAGGVSIATISYTIKNKIDGKSISLGEVLKKSFSRLGAIVKTQIINIIFIFGLTLLLIVPGIIYQIYWYFVFYVVLFKDKSGKNALDYSKTIVKGRWWKVARYSFVFLILWLIITIYPMMTIKKFYPDNFIVSIISDTLFCTLSSFYAVIILVFFLNFDATKKDVAKSQIINS